MAGEDEQLRQHISPGSASGILEASQLTRREALLQLLRVGGIAAAAAGAGFWLSERSQASERPLLPSRRARTIASRQSSNGPPHRDAVCDGRTRPTARRGAGACSEGSRKSWRHAAASSRGRMLWLSSQTSHGIARPSRPPTPILNSLPKWCASAGRRAPSASSSPM